MPEINERIEQILKSIIIDDEYTTSKTNSRVDNADYEAILNMVEGIRSEKNAQWMSDINIPLIVSHILTDAANWTSYFQTRDFVEVYLEGEPGDKPKTMATKRLINKTLNMKDVYHFHKFMRLRTINWINGNAIALCFWEQEIKTIEVEQPPKLIEVTRVVNGELVSDVIEEPVPPKKIEKIITDRFNYEPLDPRNVFMSPEYCYSAQHKRYIIVRSEKIYDDLKQDENRFGYFNLDKVKDSITLEAPESAEETYNQNDNKARASKTPCQSFDVLDRYGKIWAIVTKRDDEGIPIEISPGYDETGGIKAAAELIHCICSFATPGGKSILIRFQPSPFIDAVGRPYLPFVRSWCYLHPSKDVGLSDGKNLREIQIGINDTFNMSNDAVMMETQPTLVGRKSSLEDNPTVRQEPGHIIELEDPSNDLQQLKFRANISGAWTQINSLLTFASQTDAIFPGTMGGISGGSGTTATEFAGADTQSNKRFSLKTLTFEYTWLTEFYWVINQMTWRFARPETAMKLMGDLAYDFDPNCDYTYVPLSQSLESEHNKLRKVGVYDQMIGRLVGLANIFPQEISKLIAEIVGRQMVLMGNEYQDIAGILSQLASARPQQGEGATSIADKGGQIPASNQKSIPMSSIEMNTRGLQ